MVQKKTEITFVMIEKVREQFAKAGNTTWDMNDVAKKLGSSRSETLKALREHFQKVIGERFR